MYNLREKLEELVKLVQEEKVVVAELPAELAEMVKQDSRVQVLTDGDDEEVLLIPAGTTLEEVFEFLGLDGDLLSPLF